MPKNRSIQSRGRRAENQIKEAGILFPIVIQRLQETDLLTGQNRQNAGCLTTAGLSIVNQVNISNGSQDLTSW